MEFRRKSRTFVKKPWIYVERSWIFVEKSRTFAEKPWTFVEKSLIYVHMSRSFVDVVDVGGKSGTFVELSVIYVEKSRSFVESRGYALNSRGLSLKVVGNTLRPCASFWRINELLRRMDRATRQPVSWRKEYELDQ